MEATQVVDMASINQKSETAQEIFERELAENKPSSLHWRTFLDCAANHAYSHEPDDAASRLFLFVRIAKAHPTLAALNSNAALEMVQLWLTSATAIEGIVVKVTRTARHLSRYRVAVGKRKQPGTNINMRSRVNIHIENEAEPLRLSNDAASASELRDRLLNRVCALAYRELANGERHFVCIMRIGKRRHGYLGGLCAPRWQEVFGMDCDDAAMAFIDGWERARYAKGVTPLDLAFQRAEREPFEVENSPSAGYTLFLSLARCLQGCMGNREIYLPIDLLAKRLKVSGMTVTRYRERAKREGWLKQVGFHNHREGRATPFRFVNKRRDVR